MIFEGDTHCPVCGADIARDLRDVLRKADDTDSIPIECPKCEKDITVNVRIRHHVTIVKDE